MSRKSKCLPHIPKERIASFIRKTFYILEEGQHSEYICWTDDGTCVLIKDPNAFAKYVLPIYFKHNNLTSFIRQLNMYDFKKKKSQGPQQIYQHDLFERAKKHQLKFIKRKSSESMQPFDGDYDFTMPQPPITERKYSNHLDEGIERIRSLESQIQDLSLVKENLLKKLLERDKATNHSGSFSKPHTGNNQDSIDYIDFRQEGNKGTSKDFEPSYAGRFSDKNKKDENNMKIEIYEDKMMYNQDEIFLDSESPVRTNKNTNPSGQNNFNFNTLNQELNESVHFFDNV